MPQYLITYDLHQSGRNYEKVKKGITALGESAKLLESVWLVSHPYTASQIVDHLNVFIDGNDSVAVIELGKNWSTLRVLSEGVTFLKKHRP